MMWRHESLTYKRSNRISNTNKILQLCNYTYTSNMLAKFEIKGLIIYIENQISVATTTTYYNSYHSYIVSEQRKRPSNHELQRF